MKTVGLITEYNPFHKGHLYHIQKAKEVTGADEVVVIMSGDFVQRGAPALMPKHLRAQMALKCGASLVLELPLLFATGSAELFAQGAVTILDKLGIVDVLCFGSETGNYSRLEKTARILLDEPKEYRQVLKEKLREGNTFPKSMQYALAACFPEESFGVKQFSSNDILGIEYSKALLSLNSSMKGVAIKREDSNYHDEDLSPIYSSATAIRKLFKEGYPVEIENHIPPELYSIFRDAYNIRYPVFLDDFSLLLKTKLLRETKESLISYLDVSTELANRILNKRDSFTNFSGFSMLLKTKEMTYSRISRCLIHILLDIKKNMLSVSLETLIDAVRVLGFRKDSQELLRRIKEAGNISLVTKINSENNSNLISQDIAASDYYENVVSYKFQKKMLREPSQSMVLL
ncbi:putative nucleotidyltransferase [Aequitasia blattaphilus]|uniref:tRNA(Met) cytidine acetate ligase n=1 Tax=Aequitasia blattaphilus TaxID=2949332 RepID=A0ABT1E7Q1_9FIRM|nr:nucleotidyltransferase [Aequitasia blattaphilus]MCP1101649.1 nucleotidyltransferase [Aequitasia blattaphilus]MCR8614289.1 nucleotidyltransferase [Aequitasia blattaphilus]